MHNAQVTGATLWGLAKKRSRKPELRAFGAWLELRRGKATREQISIKLTTLGVGLGGSTLAQYEKGTVWAPDAGVLWGLAKIYGYPLEELIEFLKMNRGNPALEVSDLVLPIHGTKESKDAASARALAVKIETIQEQANKIGEGARQIMNAAFVLQKEADEIVPTKRKRQRRDRKAG